MRGNSPLPVFPNRLSVHSIGTIRHPIRHVNSIGLTEHQRTKFREWPAVLVHALQNDQTSPAFKPVPFNPHSLTHLSSPQILHSEHLIITEN